MTPIANYSGLTALCLLRQVFQLKHAEQSFNADVNFLGLAILHRPNLDLAEAQALMNTGKVLLVTRNAVESLRHNNIESGGAGVLHEPLPAEPVCRRGTRYGAVLIYAYDRQAIAFAKLTAQRNLSFNGSG